MSSTRNIPHARSAKMYGMFSKEYSMNMKGKIKPKKTFQLKLYSKLMFFSQVNFKILFSVRLKATIVTRKAFWLSALVL